MPVTDVDLMVDDDNFEWKGQESLGIRACQFQHPRGFQPQHILQVSACSQYQDAYLPRIGGASLGHYQPRCFKQLGHHCCR